MDEVRSLRGIGGAEDTAIIVTTTKFTEDAKKEAERRERGLRPVYLIDRDMLIDICKRKEIGVKKRQLPELLVFDQKRDASANIEVDSKADAIAFEVSGTTAQENGSIRNGGGKRNQRFRDEMLDDLSHKQIAHLSKYSLSTVRNYLATDRRDSLGNAIRKSTDAREEALKIVALTRHSRNRKDRKD